jgi:TPP-dependent pyruvate/acetoin dehydrogenase alpha subunit
VESALEHARSGAGPALVEAWSYRMHGHGAHDAQRYVPSVELDDWRERDPLARWQARAREEAGWTDADQADLERSIGEEIAEAVERALAAPYPDPAGLATSVFAR